MIRVILVNVLFLALVIFAGGEVTPTTLFSSTENVVSEVDHLLGPGTEKRITTSAFSPFLEIGVFCDSTDVFAVKRPWTLDDAKRLLDEFGPPIIGPIVEAGSAFSFTGQRYIIMMIYNEKLGYTFVAWCRYSGGLKGKRL